MYTMLENYETYLNFISNKLENFFESQKDYIFCHKGCAKCCKNAQFPYSLTEVNYLMLGATKLDNNTQNIIEKNMQKILEDRENFKGEKFLYDCPFLINDACSVYEYRGLVCRAFGLMTNTVDNRIQAPFCCFQGLNYSNVVNPETKLIDYEKVKAGNFSKEPVGYNVSYEFLTDHDFEKGFNFLFGDKKPLIEWFIRND